VEVDTERPSQISQPAGSKSIGHTATVPGLTKLGVTSLARNSDLDILKRMPLLEINIVEVELASKRVGCVDIDSFVNDTLEGSYHTEPFHIFNLLSNSSAGLVTTSMSPDQDTLADADYYYLGGHEYDVPDNVAQILINAGYSDYLTNI
jgi:hypothetical protein